MIDSARLLKLEVELGNAVNRFLEWQKILISHSKQISSNCWCITSSKIYFKLSKTRISHGVNGITFSQYKDFRESIVKINFPTNVKKTNGLSHVAIDSLGNPWIVRQGVLQHNERNSLNISATSFIDASGRKPDLITHSNGKPERLWFKVCRLDPSSNRVAGETLAFINMCLEVRDRLSTEPGAEERNPQNYTWNRDELILVLNLYMQNRSSPPGKSTDGVREVSGQLREMGRLLRRSIPTAYRSPDAVYMKLMNFRRFDTARAPARGLQGGGKSEKGLWDEYASRLDKLQIDASVIAAALASKTLLPGDLGDDAEDIEVSEGRIVWAIHSKRERCKKIIRQRKQQALRLHGELRCEGCKNTLEERYGDRGLGFIEVHHTRPIHTMKLGDKTRLKDLALLCANCHRMVHAKREWLSIEELQLIVVH